MWHSFVMITLIYDLSKEIFKTGNWGVTLRATPTLLNEVLLHQGHPLCNKCWLQCLQELIQIKSLILQLLCKTLPQTSSNPWIWFSLNLWILEYPCTPSTSSLESSMLRPVNEPPSTSRTVRKTPKSFGGGMRLFTSFEALMKPDQSSWENQLTTPTSTLENLCTQRIKWF